MVPKNTSKNQIESLEKEVLEQLETGHCFLIKLPLGELVIFSTFTLLRCTPFRAKSGNNLGV